MGLLRNLLGRAKPDERDTNQLIFDLAEYGVRARDLRELYRRFPSMELFAKITYADFAFESGSKHVVGQGETLAAQSATLLGGETMAQFFVDKSDPRLQPKFIGMTVREACEMVLKIDHLDGLMLCNPQDSWFAIPKSEIEKILRQGMA